LLTVTFVDGYFSASCHLEISGDAIEKYLALQVREIVAMN